MIVNLGLVELGGMPIDGFDMDGYIFKFADTNLVSGDLRVWSSIKRLTHFYHHKHPDVRVFVNYDSPECLAMAVKYLTMFRDEYSSVAFLFSSGEAVKIK